MILPPLSLYIHIPWCVRKCPYCDFNSHRSDTELPEESYVQQLLLDLQADLDQGALQGRVLTSIFFGGGTPSLFSPQAIGDILSGVEEELPFASDIEITLEANPGTVDQDRFQGFYHAGVNRLSIGVQSFNDEQLQSLGRIHRGGEAKRAIEAARLAGFDNINLDLMHGLPGQSLELALTDLRSALEFQPEHLSWYQLTIETNTEFYRHPPVLPEDEILWAIQEQGQQLLADQGFEQYEVSAYSRKGRQAQHNLDYWTFGDYLGIGAGAHGKWTDMKNQAVLRSQKTRLPKDFLSRINKGKYQQVSADELTFEFLMNALRLKSGVAQEVFVQRTGLPWSTLEKVWQPLVAKKLVHADRIQTTDAGYLFLNQVLEPFIED